MRSGLVCAANPGKKDGTGTDAEFNTPNGVCMANNGRLAFVVEGSALAATGSVRQIVVATGAVTRVAGIGGAGSPLDGIGYNNRFYYPKACAATADGSIVYVIEAATNHNRLRKVVVDTKVVTTVAGVLSSTAPSTVDGQGTNAQFNIPTGIALGDDASMAYIADFDGNTIRQVELASGTVTTFAGSGNDGYADGVGTVAEFDQPTGIAFSASSATSASPSGVLYVTDANNYRVRRIDVATRQVTTVTGLGTSGNDDGDDTVATFKTIAGIAVSADGNSLLVADKGSHRIRQILLRGLVPFPPGSPPPPLPPPPPSIFPFSAMLTRPGYCDGFQGGNVPNGWGWALLKSDGYITRPGGGATSDTNDPKYYNPSNGIDLWGWEAPTDGGWTRIYENNAAWVATKPDGTMDCFGASQFGVNGCPSSTAVLPDYPKPISFVFSGLSGFCARKRHAQTQLEPLICTSMPDSMSDVHVVQHCAPSPCPLHCLVYNDTSVYCWTQGKMANSPSGTGWLTIVARAACYAALNVDGSIHSWHNTGTAVNAVCNDAPPTGEHFVAIWASGSSGFVALSRNGTLACWNGIETSNTYSTADERQCPTGDGYIAVKESQKSFCALRFDGGVHCWSTLVAHIGLHYTSKHNYPFPADKGYVSLYANQQAWAGLKADGSVKTWGDGSPQGGGGSTGFGGGDAGADALTDVKRIYTGRSAFVALKNDGILYCWGNPTTGGAMTKRFFVRTGYVHRYGPKKGSEPRSPAAPPGVRGNG